MYSMKRARTPLVVLGIVLLLVAAAFAQVKKAFSTPGLKVGTVAPNFTLPDQDGKTHSLKADTGKVVLLAFYPADFTGGCTIEAHSLTSATPDLQAMGVQVYGVSVQDSKSHKDFCSKEGIPYTLLADTQKRVAKNYGVFIPGVMGGIANRVTYILGKDGHVVYADSDVDGHLTTCGADWVTWLKAHPDVTGGAAAAPTAPATLGQALPDFSLPNAATGQTVSLASAREGHKATVVMFIATHCPVSNAYNTRMEALAQKYTSKGVAFLAINSNQTEPTAEVASHAKAHGFTFPVLKDDGSKIADVFDAHVTPETFVTDANGTLVYHGRIDNSQDPAGVKKQDLAAALDEVLAGQPVVNAQTKAFGCTIKRSGE